MHNSFLSTPALLKEEIETFNQVRVQGSPRWLAKREKLANAALLPPLRRYRSIVFAVSSVEEKEALLKKRVIFVAGQVVHLADYHQSTAATQCTNCYKYSYSGAACRAKGCKFCILDHYSKDHVGCKDCKVSGQLCSHQRPACRNCKGDHLATSLKCSLAPPARAKATPKPTATTTTNSTSTVATPTTAETDSWYNNTNSHSTN